MTTTTIGRRELLLLLLSVDGSGVAAKGISGITRLQKLLFLLEREGHITPSGEGFEFRAYKAGPYSKKLYDDLELLENLGFIASASAAESTEVESADIAKLGFDDLIGEPAIDSPERGYMAIDSYEERRFRLTDKGLKKAEALLKNAEIRPVVDSIRAVKGKFSHYSLSDLLRYVYERHEDMTTESEIIEKVLRRRRK